ncbi:MAG: acetyl-CoA carboxylase carboxyl transferase subunit beta [Planctomycetota bacterium]|jgi:acetyl-CoA carboxylase carboxyl transferase subunit beta|nr:acetyl-CoA carboxylase carboxyl transferase subunit beta [Planctomycetota bacterium]
MALEWRGLKSKLGLRPQTGIREIGTGPGAKCERCGEVLMRVDFEASLRVCGKCGHHHVLGAEERIQATIDYGAFEELDPGLAAVDVFGFKGAGIESYAAKLAKSRSATGLADAMLSGLGRLRGRPIAIGATDSRFLAGSMGAAMGERFVRLAEAAAARRLPLIVFSGSGGGARMYEGLFSLFQMAKTAAAVNLLDRAGVPFLSVCTQSTMGGVWASWASLGDIILAEPEAQIGFTGPRVIKTTIKAELPPGFQSAEFLLEHGQIDQIVPRLELRDRLAGLLDKLLGPVPADSASPGRFTGGRES